MQNQRKRGKIKGDTVLSSSDHNMLLSVLLSL